MVEEQADEKSTHKRETERSSEEGWMEASDEAEEVKRERLAEGQSSSTAEGEWTEGSAATRSEEDPYTLTRIQTIP